jgi:hypothetical protein
MRRAITIVTVCMFVGLASIPAWGDNPHYLKADASFDSNTACYSVAIKEAGLGNSGLSELTYTLTCSANFTTVCQNKGGNNVQGQPKSGSGSATSTTTLDIRNGQTNGTITVCPAAFDLPDPGCTGSQKELIIAALYSGCTLADSLGTDSPDLADLGGSNLSVPAP